jgi:hypothetical protein
VSPSPSDLRRIRHSAEPRRRAVSKHKSSTTNDIVRRDALWLAGPGADFEHVNTVAMPEGSTLSARVRAEWALPVTRFVFVIVVATAVSLWWLERFHVTAKEPLWLLVTVVAVGYLFCWIAHLAYVTAPSRRRLRLRIVVQVTLATTLMYLTGWGPALTLAFVIVARDNLTVAEENPWPEIAAWVAAAVVAAQTAVSLGFAPSFIQLPDEYGLVVLTALATLMVIRTSCCSTGRPPALRRTTAHHPGDRERRLRGDRRVRNRHRLELAGRGALRVEPR